MALTGHGEYHSLSSLSHRQLESERQTDVPSLGEQVGCKNGRGQQVCTVVARSAAMCAQHIGVLHTTVGVAQDRKRPAHRCCQDQTNKPAALALGKWELPSLRSTGAIREFGPANFKHLPAPFAPGAETPHGLDGQCNALAGAEPISARKLPCALERQAPIQAPLQLAHCSVLGGKVTKLSMTIAR